MATYHDQNSETTAALYPAAERLQHRNQQRNYKLSQDHSVKIEGWYEMPMRLHGRDRFERLNNFKSTYHQIIICLIKVRHVMFIQEKPKKAKTCFH